MSWNEEPLEPPRLADRFLSWFCRDELLEEVKGDLHEFYGMELVQKSPFQAKLSYWFHVFHFLRSFALKRKTQKANNITMYKSYVKTGVRNLKRQRLASFINIFGLATTIAISLVVYVLLDRQYSLDKFHAGADRIFSIQSKINWNGQEETWGRSPLLLAPSLEAELPQIETATRVTTKRVTARFEDQVFRETLTFADPTYLSLFSFPLSQGSASALKEKQQVILSQQAANKYFDYGSAIGQEIKIMVNDQPYLFRVAGVAAPLPKTASFEFDFLVNLEYLGDMFGTDLNGWQDLRQQGVFTFVKLEQAAISGSFNPSLDKFRALSNETNPDWPIDRFQLNELTSLARNAQFVREVYASGSTPQILIMFAIISLLLLTSACFNYVNIAVSMAQKRLNEIAVRKVVGGQRKQLISQFLTENFILCFIATIVGVIMAVYGMLPGVNAIFTSDYSIDIFSNPTIMLFLVVLFVSLSLISGAYPAFYISGFKPVTILGGKQQLGGKKRLSKVLLTGQFFLTFIAIVSGLLFTNINEFQEDQDWGYDADDLLVVPLSNQEQYDVLRSYSEQSPMISDWAGSQSLIGTSASQTVVEFVDRKLTVRSFTVGADYPDLLNIQVAEGRSFNENLSTDDHAIMVNRQFLKKAGLNSGSLGETLKINGETYTIIGVMEDFHFDDFFNPIAPAILRLGAEEGYRYISIKAEGGELSETESMIKSTWHERFPDSPYTGFAQVEVFDNFFQSTGSLKKIMNFVALVAIVLSIMGLFGLASLMIARRLKEFSIRKVLGAGGLQIAGLVSRQFIGFMVIALCMGVPISYFGFNTIFSQMFPGSLDAVTALPFVTSIGLLLTVILLTISSHIVQLLKMSPANNLRGDR